MPRTKDHASLQRELVSLLAEACPGMQIAVEHSERWGRTCVTFRWAGFEGMLAEERFRRLLMCLPEAFREEQLHGAVWLELAPGETVDDYLKLPRSEDIVDRERVIARRLIRAAFFDELQARLGPLPVERCSVSLSMTKSLLQERGLSPEECLDACLLLIRHGAYSDCDVLLHARPSILALEESS